MAENRGWSGYVDLSEIAARSTAEADPDAFVDALPKPAVIDEAQLVDELTVAVKRWVDTHPGRGQVVLTGSARIGRGALGGSDPLAGRAVRVRLRPMTSSERHGEPHSSLDWLESGELVTTNAPSTSREQLIQSAVTGGLPGFPGVVRGPTSATAAEALGMYLDSALSLPDGRWSVDRARLSACAVALLSQPAQLLNISRVSSDLGLKRDTVAGYIDLLERCFLLDRLTALRPNSAQEQSAHPKLHPLDTSLAVWAQRSSVSSLLADGPQWGPLFESLVFQELSSMADWATPARPVWHWRNTKTREEVDVVVGGSNGSLVGFEVKASTAVDLSDARGLLALRSAFPSRFTRGFVVYSGDWLRPLGDDIWALPYSLLVRAAG